MNGNRDIFELVLKHGHLFCGIPVFAMRVVLTSTHLFAGVISCQISGTDPQWQPQNLQTKGTLTLM